MIFICFINVYKIIIARIYDLDIIQLFRTVYLHYLVHHSILAVGIIFCFMFVSLPLVEEQYLNNFQQVLVSSGETIIAFVISLFPIVSNHFGESILIICYRQ